jgi:hypothetical protein
MKIGAAIKELAAAERELADRLTAVGERHRTEHDVYHVTTTLARIERGHKDALARHAARYDVELDVAGGGSASSTLVQTAREKGAELLGRRKEPGLLLLRDLRELHVLAAGVSLDWVALGQGAQAARDTELLDAVTHCHSETLRTLKWTTGRLKEAAPQALTT